MAALKVEYEEGDPRNLLWAFSFMSYSMPTLFQSCIDAGDKSVEVLLSMREECVMPAGSHLFMAVGVLLDISKVGQMRRRFTAKDVDDEEQWLFDEWQENFAVTCLFMWDETPSLIAGAALGNLLFFCPGVAVINYDHNYQRLEIASFRQRDIRTLCAHAKAVIDTEPSRRPLMAMHVRNRTR